MDKQKVKITLPTEEIEFSFDTFSISFMKNTSSRKQHFIFDGIDREEIRDIVEKKIKNTKADEHFFMSYGYKNRLYIDTEIIEYVTTDLRHSRQLESKNS